MGCYWNSENANDESFKGLHIEFKSDSTLDVIKHGQITQTSNWKVVNGDGGLYAVDVNPRVFLLYGRILFCEGRVEFDDAYRDGCSNFFVKNE